MRNGAKELVSVDEIGEKDVMAVTDKTRSTCGRSEKSKKKKRRQRGRRLDVDESRG